MTKHPLYNENYFLPYRNHTIGSNHSFKTPYGQVPLVYADWTASGRLYKPIEDKLIKTFGPLVANTHTETNYTGTFMTHAYHEAMQIIKKHVNASQEDVLINVGSGMTGALAKLQRILGLKVPSQVLPYLNFPESEKPVVFVTHMEHHSNQTSWFETLAEVEIIAPTSEGLVDLNSLSLLLERYKDRKYKIASVTGCSNVTGIQTPYHKIAALMHAAGGVCFADFACSAPYVAIDMHPAKEAESLDAIFFSPHKFLGGPASSGVLIFNKKLYGAKQIPDQPGGGTVLWTNPWGEHEYLEDIEQREDGGTPAFLQTIKTALCIKLKEQMGVEAIREREKQLVGRIFEQLKPIKNLHILAENIQDRLPVISFYIDEMHYNLGVKMLNDRFGIQMRGGCSCAGTYGHYLLGVEKEFSHRITHKIHQGDFTEKPGWIRMSVHPTTKDAELDYILNALADLAAHHKIWANDYEYVKSGNNFLHKAEIFENIQEMFKL
jgi:selenocysteine lyase/cysteine desulfurase